ncbi:MAG: MarR family transcriptional regulator [Chloroflexi bacterium]|nr:MAG: MarR family transcriptional regulator [Chloroflexota bacterium]
MRVTAALVRRASSVGRHAAKRLSMTELANAVLLSKSGLTRLVDRIEEAGLVQRASAPGDRSSLLIVLTPSGEKTLKRAGTHPRGRHQTPFCRVYHRQ